MTRSHPRSGVLLALALLTAVVGCDKKSTTTPNRPPDTPTIGSPSSGATFVPGTAIQFQGSASDPEDGNLSGVQLVWTSSIDGQIGTGASFSRNDLSEGTHTITLRATDSDGASRTATVSITVANEAPVATISQPADNASFGIGESIDFQGSATDAEDGALSGGDLVWTSNIDGQIGTGGSFSRADLSEGTHTITLTATDSQGKTGQATVTITVENQAPATPVISAPADGGSAQLGASVQFQGSATDPEDGVLSGDDLVWTSDIDGEIGTGTSFSTTSLSVGEHTITLTATDSDGRTSSASITFTVLAPPTATITAPADNSTFAVGSTIDFEGSGTDAEDGALTGASLVWNSSIDGDFGTGETVSLATLSAGTHTVTLTATDSDGLTGTATITVVVQTLGSPTAVITSPANNSAFAPGQAVTFQGSATDPEDGALTGASLVWTSNLDGQIGTGISFSTAGLSVGTHTVTLTATDSDSQTGTAVVTVIISAPPAASITSPTGGSTFSAGASVSFQGSATDPEDGALTGSSLVWSSSRDGQIGTGESFSSSSLSVGVHVITLAATDSNGQVGTAQVSITINPAGSPPVVSITAPGDGSTAVLGASVGFTGTATDTEDGNIAASLSWSSNKDGAIGTGASFSTSSLTVGTHTITASVTDSDGWMVTDQITLTILSPPTASISAPANNATVTAGASTTFIGSASDPEDGALTGASLVWVSDKDGQIGTGTSFSTSSLSLGAHVITLTATDSDGLTDDAVVNITVNDAPTATITAPANGASYNEGDNVSFTGTGSDTEDSAGSLTLSWSSSIDGVLGTGTSLSTSSLSAGTHTITLTVTDTQGGTDTDQITITVNSTSSPIVVEVGATASSTINVGEQKVLPIVVDMTNAAGRDVATLNLKITWDTGVATYVSATNAVGSGLASKNEGSVGSGELTLGWIDTSGQTSTFTAWNVTLEGAGSGSTTVTVQVVEIKDETATDLSGDTGTRNHILTVN